MIATLRKPAWPLGVLLLVSGFAAAQAASGQESNVLENRVTGTIAYRERIALPPTSEIKASLVDVSLADAPAVVLAWQVIQAGGRQVPFAFALDFDPSTIEASHTYAVQVRIEDQGRLLFISDTVQRVITRGAPLHVDVMVRSVRQATATPSPTTSNND